MKRYLPLSILALVLVVASAASSCGSSEKEGQEQSGSSAPTRPAASAVASATSAPTQSPTRVCATASATVEEDIDTIIRDYLLGRDPALKGVTMHKKCYYADSSGTDWAMFAYSPIPEGATDPGYGITKKVPGGSWEVVAGPGTALVHCDLPPDVQVGLGLHDCSSMPTVSPTAAKTSSN
jgi:hypothetical protein